MSYRVSLSANQHWKFYRGVAAPVRFGRQRISPWDDSYDDSAWEVVALPHTVRNEALNCSGGKNYQGECWYRRRFTVPRELKGRTLTFELEAAMQRVDAWLDGEPLGYREGGFLPMAFDLSGLDVTKEHLLVFRVDNSDQPDVPPAKPQTALDFCYFGGLYRDAWLHATHPVHFTEAVHAGRRASGGLFLHTKNVSSAEATITVDAHVENRWTKAATLRLELLLDGERVYAGECFPLNAGGERVESATFRLESPRLWHPHHPNLYTLTARLWSGDELLDEISQKIGVRDLQFRPDGCYVNGEKLYLNGANRHQEYPYVGFALPDRAQYRDVRLLRDAGILCIRLGHYPQDKAFMDACDELGVLCIIPTPGWQIHPSSVRFDEASYENTRRMIRMNRNHPSACLWEPILNETSYPEYFAKKQLEIVTEELGGDPVYAACDGHYAYAAHYPVLYGLDPISDRPRYVREYGDSWIEQFGPMNTLRRVRRGKNASFYAGGEAAMLRSAQERFEAYVIARQDENLSGAAMWAGIDHNRGYDPSEAAVGILDLQRLPKYHYHLMSAQQEIGLVGGICFIANHWTAESPRDVQVYTNAPAVRLSLNGREIGTVTAQESWKETKKYDERLTGSSLDEKFHPPVIFRNVPWEQGVLTAEALWNGTVVATHRVRTPQAPVRICLEPQWAGAEGWTADGSDLLLVHAFLRDENGVTVPWAEPLVSFRTVGDVSIVGDGEGWVKANPMRAEAGVATVLLRAGETPETITLIAESEGLEAGVVEIALQESTLPRLPSPPCVKPKEKPVYPCDEAEFFSFIHDPRKDARYAHDVAREKPATASSTRADLSPSNVNHAVLRDPWIAADASLPQWWQVDLGEEINVSGLILKWYSDGLWYGYTAETSLDGKEWTVGAEGSASGQSTQPIHLNKTVCARYVRINVLSVSGDAPAGLYKAEVYGKRK